MSAVSNLDLFKELFNFIKSEDVTLDDVLKEHGGSNIYIPSHKTTCRNTLIINEYKNNPTKATIRKLSKEWDISESQVYIITKEVREPTLFDIAS